MYKSDHVDLRDLKKNCWNMRAAFLALVATTCALAAISPDSVAAGNTEQLGGVWGALFKTPGEVAPTRCSCILSVTMLSRLGHTRSDEAMTRI